VNAEETFHPVGFPLKDLNDIISFDFPDPDDPELFAEVEKQIADTDRENNLIMLSNPGCLFTRAWLLRGMENFLVDMLAEPDKAGELFDIIFKYQKTIVERELKFKPDIVYFGDDAGTTKALMIDPQLWRKMIKPRLAELVGMCRESGCFVMFHCCGCIQDIIEIGVNILNPVQASANDLSFLKEMSRNKLTLYGGIDSDIIMRGTPDEVGTLTEKTTKILGESGGYIAFSDQSLPFPKKNIETVRETVVRFETL